MRIIYFDIDCLRPDHLSCYGYDRPTSPNIDGIAGQGTRFTNYFCASSPCVPSRTALFSGRFGLNNGVISNHTAGAQFRIADQLYMGARPENDMFPRHLRRNGYETYSFSNFADRHNAMWFMRGWTEFHTINLKGGNETAEEVNARVLPWLETHACEPDYFLHINYWDAHRCYKMDPSWSDRFDGMPVSQEWPNEGAIQAHQNLTGPFTANRQFRDNQSLFPLMPGSVASREDFENMITGYDAAIAYVDHHVGQVLTALKAAGVYDDAAVIVSADHGDAFGEHGIYSDHVNADNCIHNIPLIIKWPGVAAPTGASHELLYNLDLPPTLCEILGVEPPKMWDGESFARLFGDESLPDESEAGREFLVWDCGLYAVQRAVRTPDHLMIRTYDPFEFDLPPVELFEINHDRYQTRNLAPDAPEIVRKMDGMMAAWIQEQVSKHAPPVDPVHAIIHERHGTR